ncbi:patatin-like phospholipase family protein [Desertibacillus haloalkaliphilus]|uniref:patatin-like phospholipase family protein n=1 Tax=Desertibacillus haloalkaliphilus TaxID=1328930 RepID=UPI001C27859D|nr:patatin-like phospholipase family protein [Desertibacillus haloalkaliphilus]MBU8907713.1 patatin-like phospholipase family protein [Desertibacillus haloalkaliphilus]
MEIDGVFEGGGVKSLAFIGALREVERKEMTFDRIAGTSAGSVIASFIKAGYTSQEIESLVTNTDFTTFMDPINSILPFRFAKWARVYWKLGLYRGNLLEQWLSDQLAVKGVKTFADLPEGSLKIIASDLTRGRLIVLPDDLEQYGLLPEKFPVARAVRMSCSIPYFFEPVKVTGASGKRFVIVDGGVLSNFPIWLFLNKKTNKLKRPLLGFRLSPKFDDLPENDIKNALGLFHSLFETMLRAHDLRYITKDHTDNIVFIPVESVTATDFDLSLEKKKALINIGRERTNRFLKQWTY